MAKLSHASPCGPHQIGKARGLRLFVAANFGEQLHASDQRADCRHPVATNSSASHLSRKLTGDGYSNYVSVANETAIYMRQ